MSYIEHSCEQPAMSWSTSQIIEQTGLTTRQLYYWESVGLVQPKFERFGKRLFRRYQQEQLECLLEIKAWLEVGYSLEAVRKMRQSCVIAGEALRTPEVRNGRDDGKQIKEEKR